MLSFAYMRLLESRPRRYDLGISWLSLGKADEVRRVIIGRYVTAGSRVLDIGTGTGTLALMAAAEGAEVTGIDVSAGMLAVADRKRGQSPAGDRVRFIQAGVAEMETALAGQRFDLVTAFLVFSELSDDEQRYALHRVRELLEPGGRLIIVDEVRPSGLAYRALYDLVRIPIALVTFAITQTTTRAVTDLEAKVCEAGFELDDVETRSLGTLIMLCAHGVTR